MFRPSLRRSVLLAAATLGIATAGPAQMRPIDSGALIEAVQQLRAGQFLWAPELSPDGPMLVVVNIATQRLVAYRNGVPIAISTVSTGRSGHRTPVGVFSILQKARYHRSNLYSNAPMPFMQRLTWSGIALHGGQLPGYPASHGCIRLPHDFARRLFAETALGMTVVVVDQPERAAMPLALSPHPRVLAPAVWQPERAADGPVSIVVSGADRRMVVLRGGVEIGSAPVRFSGVIDRVQGFTLADTGQGYQWRRLDLPGGGAGSGGGGDPAFAPAGEQSDSFRRALAGVVAPGTTLVVVPDALDPQSLGGAPQRVVLDEEPAVADWLSDGQVTSTR